MTLELKIWKRITARSENMGLNKWILTGSLLFLLSFNTFAVYDFVDITYIRPQGSTRGLAFRSVHNSWFHHAETLVYTDTIRTIRYIIHHTYSTGPRTIDGDLIQANLTSEPHTLIEPSGGSYGAYSLPTNTPSQYLSLFYYIDGAVPPSGTSELSNESESSSTTDPIDTKNGNNYFTEKRIAVPGPSIPLNVDLKYQSVSDVPIGTLGKGWRHTLEVELDVQSSQAVLYTGDGRKRIFPEDGSGGYLSPDEKNWTLEQVAGGYEVMMPGGMTYVFDTTGELSTITDAWGNGITCSYGTNDCLESATHSNGRQILFNNEWQSALGQWRVANISVIDGSSLDFDYNSDGQFTQIVERVDSERYTSHYQYADGFLTNKINGAGFEYAYAYETGTNGLLNGKATSLDVDGFYAHDVEYTYADETQVTYSLRGTQQIYRYSRNPDQLLTTRYGPSDQIADIHTLGTEYAYAANNQDKTEDTLFDTVKDTSWSKWMQYDDSHNMTNYAVSYGTETPVHQLSMEYDPVWQLPTAVENAEGDRVETAYTNGLPAITKAFYSDTQSHDIQYAYTPNGLVSSIINPNQHATSFGYDAEANLTSVSAPLGPVATNTYDALGFVQTAEVLTQNGAQTGRITHFNTDAKGRVQTITHPDGLTESFAYNALDYLTNAVDRAGRITELTYAPTRKLTSTIRYLNKGGSNVPVRIGYDLDEQVNLLRISEPAGRYVESYKLDIQDRVTTVTNIENQVMHFGYTIGDFVSWVDRFDRSIIDNEYDTAGRVDAVIYNKGKANQETIDYSYYLDGEIKTVSDSTSAFTNTYDRLNRLVAVTSSIPSVVSVANYQYDPVGNLTNSTVSIGNQQSVIGNAYSYDAAERLTGISSHQGTETQSFDYGYNPENGLIASVTNAESGMVCSYGYDLMDRVTNITYRTGTSVLIRSLAYTYDAVSMIREKRISNSEQGTPNTKVSYTYDSLDRLVHEFTSTNRHSVFDIGYSYDLAGNRKTKTENGFKTTYALGSGNRLASSSTASNSALFVSGSANELIGTDNRWGELWVTNFTAGAGTIPSVNGDSFFTEITSHAGVTNQIKAAIRDQAGNMSYIEKDYFVDNSSGTPSSSTYSYDTAGCMDNLNGTTLGWDERYRLKSVSNTSSYVAYDYDVLDRRVSRIDGSSTNYFIYNGNQVVADLDENGDLLRTYVWGTGIDNLLSLTDHTTTNTYYAIKDHQNTIIALVDDTGAVVESYEYDAYGNTKVFSATGTELTESGVGNRYCFQGREIDWETGLYYFRARWYDPETGRWLSKDPIGISGGLNQFVFVSNNPVNAIDPLGLSGTLTIHSDRGDGELLSGHSWITYEWDYGYSHTFSTWRGNADIVDRLGEFDRPGVSTSRHLDDAAEGKLFKEIEKILGKGLDSWKYLSPCSDFSSDMWNKTGKNIRDRNWLGISNPNTLADSINKLNQSDCSSDRSCNIGSNK